MTGEALAGKAVAVTGATGFVGGALTRRLLAIGAKVRVVGRGLERAQALIDAGATAVVSDLDAFDTFPDAVEGQEVVFHVAAWLFGDEARAHRLNVDATRALAEACAAAGVRRLVLVSSVAVYGLPGEDHVTEEAPLSLDQRNTYGRTKALGDVAAQEVGEATGLEVVVIRPGMVYGPGSRGWTVGMAKLVKSGAPCVFGAGDGLAFPVFIDNLVDALLLAAVAPDAAGEAFHIADTSLTWKQFMQCYGDMLGKRPRSAPLWVVKALVMVAPALRISLPLDRERLALVQRKLVFDTDKARRLLGWAPAIPLTEGMKRSEAWLRETGRI